MNPVLPNVDVVVVGAGGGEGSEPKIPPDFGALEAPSLLSPRPNESPPNEGVESDIDASRDMLGAGGVSADEGELDG